MAQVVPVQVDDLELLQAGPFIWTAPAERILENVMKCRATSESLH